MARGNTGLTAFISDKNQIDFQKWIGPKDNKSSADTPELSLLPEAIDANLKSTSSGTTVTKTYNWIVRTGDFRVNDVLDQITWQLFLMMIGWDVHLCKIPWQTQDRFVTETRMLTAIEGFDLETAEIKIRGFSMIWPFEVDMYFLTENLRVS